MIIVIVLHTSHSVPQPHHHHAFDCCSIGIFDNSAYDRQTSSLASLSPDIETKDEAVAPKSPFFSRWRKPLALLRPQRSIAPSLRAWRNIKKPGRGTFSDFFFRALFAPQAPSRARDRVRARLWTFRYETLPSFRHRAQARLYRAILRRQESLRKIRRGAVLSLLLGRRRLRGQSAGNIASGRRLPSRATSQTLEDADSGTMANSGSTESGMRWGDSDEPGREWGARRRKVYGYLKAANELRQIYASQLSQRNRQDSYDGESLDVPGAFPDVDIARSGDEEMVLFPSYTRRRVRKKRPEASGQSQRKPGTDENIERPRSPGDLEFWKQEWEKYEEDNASVDVDVRGWIYTPQHGSMSRKHRLLIALARKLSGIPAPSTSSNGSPLSGQLGLQQAVKEDEEVAREAQSIINRAEREADPAWKGGHFRGPDGRQGADGVSRVASQVSTSSLGKDELSVANARLMERLRPFMANPLVGTPVTMFFFNDKESQARTTATDGAGHFSFRAALGFVPTHVRVIASESLSATEEVQIIEPKGVSLISDIDDTIKHTAITSGAKEMFRNTFVRELEDLAIPGIKEWYTKMANMGVRMHYVSNSPWQLYPLLKRYFTLVGLPPGSFHLKQYSGMLQGIFEPTAERKRGALEKIMADFPERKFILVGDSGEADLEVYTDLVLANPGRVLAVFIRDITTLEKRGFFDQSFDHNGVSRPNPRTVPMKHDSDAVDNRPPLPPRRPVEQRSNSASANARTLDNADLISLGESGNETDQNPDSANRKPPVKPTKPSALRTTSADSATQSKNDDEETSSTVQQKEVIRRKPAPPLPSKPRSLSIPRPGPSAERPPPLPARPKPNPATDSPASSALPSAKSEPYQPAESYMGAVKNMVSTAYSSLPSMTREHLNSRSNTPNDSGTESQPGEERRTRSQRPPPPVPPPRRSNTAASTASSASAGPETLRGPTSNANAASYDRVLKLSSSSSSLSARASSASSRPVPSRTNTNISTTSTTTTTNSNNDYDSGLTYHDPSDGLPQPPAPLPNKREELWRRRWERAQAVLDEHGVILASWRVGSDVEDIAVWLVEAAQKSK